MSASFGYRLSERYPLVRRRKEYSSTTTFPQSRRRIRLPDQGSNWCLFLNSDNVLFPRLDSSQTSNLDSVVSSSSPFLDARPPTSIILNDCNRPRSGHS